jgi:ABC-2 type transport system ATP-binding protein
MIGVVFQQRTLDLDLSVIQNLTYHAALHGIGKHDGCARADDVLARIELSDRANDKVRKLSGGQMRRVEVARALLHRPRLLVLDEPTVGLDIKSRADILGYVRRSVVPALVEARRRQWRCRCRRLGDIAVLPTLVLSGLMLGALAC